MDDLTLTNAARGLGIVAGVLDRQRHEYLCGKCASFAKTAGLMREVLAIVKAEDITRLPEGAAKALAEAEAILNGIALPEEPLKQRKLGACAFPGKVCYVKKTRKILVEEIIGKDRLKGEENG